MMVISSSLRLLFARSTMPICACTMPIIAHNSHQCAYSSPAPQCSSATSSAAYQHHPYQHRPCQSLTAFYLLSTLCTTVCVLRALSVHCVHYRLCTVCTTVCALCALPSVHCMHRIPSVRIRSTYTVYWVHCLPSAACLLGIHCLLCAPSTIYSAPCCLPSTPHPCLLQSAVNWSTLYLCTQATLYLCTSNAFVSGRSIDYCAPSASRPSSTAYSLPLHLVDFCSRPLPHTSELVHCTPEPCSTLCILSTAS